MNADIRLSIGFWQHPKTRKTVKRLGLEGVRSLQILWLWAAQNRPDGNLSGMDWEDIELAADWSGEDRAFFDFCLGVWLDEASDGYSLHDWQEHNAWAADADDRSDKARFSRLATVNRKAYEALKAQGSNAVSREEYERLTTVQRPSDGRQTDVDDSTTSRQRNANVPPTPSPALKNKKEDLKPPSSSENEDPARDTRSSQVGLGEEKSDTSGEKAEQRSDADPSVEFQELRQWYSLHCRPEGRLAGFSEFRQAKAARTWPGQTRIYDDLTTRSASDKWRSGYAPSLANYLRTQGWMAPPEPEARASPPGPRAMTVRDAETLERNQRAKMLLAARAAREERHAQTDGDAGAFDLAGAALPAGAVYE